MGLSRSVLHGLRRLLKRQHQITMDVRAMLDQAAFRVNQNTVR